MTENSKESILKNRKKQILGWVWTFVIIGAIYGAGLLLFNYVPFFSRLQHYVIVTGSMEPVISIGDVVLVDQNVDFASLEEGDIIAFEVTIPSQTEKVIVVHYLDEILVDGEGVRTFRTRPEISDDQDDWILSEADIVGLHLMTIPKIGSALLFLSSPFGRIVIIVDVILLYIIFSKFSTKKRSDKRIENSL